MENLLEKHITNMVNHPLFWNKFDGIYSQKYKNDVFDIKIRNLDERVEQIEKTIGISSDILRDDLNKIAVHMQDTIQSHIKESLTKTLLSDEQIIDIMSEVKKKLYHDLRTDIDKILNESIQDPNKQYIIDKFLTDLKQKSVDIFDQISVEHNNRVLHLDNKYKDHVGKSSTSKDTIIRNSEDEPDEAEEANHKKSTKSSSFEENLPLFLSGLSILFSLYLLRWTGKFEHRYNKYHKK